MTLETRRARVMPPQSRRRRDQRRLRRGVVIAVLAAVVLGLLIGGVAEIGRASKPYWRSVDRSYAAQATALVRRSNQSEGQLARLLGTMPSLARPTAQARLDQLVATTSAVASSTKALSPPAPAAGAGPLLEQAMTERAEATADLQATVDRLLQMTPLQPTGTTAKTSATVPTLSAPAAAARLVTVGHLLESSDAAYAAFAHRLSGSIGHPKVPASRWASGRGAWSATAVGALVANLSASQTLAPLPRVVLLQNGVALSPEPVPPAAQPGAASAAPPGASVLPPTGSLQVSAVVANDGNVDVARVVVRASLQPEPVGTAVVKQVAVGVAAGSSAAVNLPALAVRSRQEYELTIALRPAPGQQARSGLSQTYLLWVAPAT